MRAQAKHFFDYDLEGVSPQTRQQISVNVSIRDQVEYFSPPFEAAVKRGKTQSVMCSYNAVVRRRLHLSCPALLALAPSVAASGYVWLRLAASGCV